MGGDWMTMDRFPELVAGEIPVWRIDLARSGGSLDDAYAVLSREERERAARMRAGVPRDEFVVGRGSLRRLLGAAVGLEPGELVLEKDSHGKPRLRTAGGIGFNVAHSRGLILIGMTKSGEIGVDVEYRDSGVELDDVARTVFHDEELAEMEKAGTAESRLAGFYDCWARKEAVVKADGRGLTMQVRKFAVGPDDGGEVEVVLPASLGGARYFVRSVDVGPGYSAAIAASECGFSVRCTEFAGIFV